MLSIVKSALFNNGQSFDKNGNVALHLSPLAGAFPTTSHVLSGTVAINAGIESGRVYLVNSNFNKVVELSDGRKVSNYNIEVIQEVKGMDVLDAIDRLGEVKNVGEPVSRETLAYNQEFTASTPSTDDEPIKVKK